MEWRQNLSAPNSQRRASNAEVSTRANNCLSEKLNSKRQFNSLASDDNDQQIRSKASLLTKFTRAPTNQSTLIMEHQQQQQTKEAQQAIEQQTRMQLASSPPNPFPSTLSSSLNLEAQKRSQTDAEPLCDTHHHQLNSSKSATSSSTGAQSKRAKKNHPSDSSLNTKPSVGDSGEIETDDAEQDDNLGIPIWPTRAETLEFDFQPVQHKVYSLKDYSQVASPSCEPESRVQEFQKSRSGHDWYLGKQQQINNPTNSNNKNTGKRLSDTSMYRPRSELMKSSSKTKVDGQLSPSSSISTNMSNKFSINQSNFNANSRQSIASTSSINATNQPRHLRGSRMDRMRKLFAAPLSLRSSSSSSQTPTSTNSPPTLTGDNKQPRFSLQPGSRASMLNKPNHLMHAVYHRTGAHFGRNSQVRSKNSKGFRVYGCPLATANNIYPITCFGQTDIYKNQQSVPYVLPRLCNYIETTSSSLTHEGIFRVSGNARLMEKLRTLFDHLGDAPLEIEAVDVATSASMLKMYLRELPEPLIPTRMSIYFISLAKKYFNLLSKDPSSQQNTIVGSSSSSTSKSTATSVSDTGISGHKLSKLSNLQQHQQSMRGSSDAAFMRDLTKLIHKLPPDNYNLLKYLCCFLHRVTLKQKYNKMCAEALGIVFGPNIFRIRNESYKGLKEQELSNLIMAVIISDYKKIFDCELTDPLGNIIKPDEGDEGRSEEQVTEPKTASKPMDTAPLIATKGSLLEQYKAKSELNRTTTRDPITGERKPRRARRKYHRCCVHRGCSREGDDEDIEGGRDKLPTANYGPSTGDASEDDYHNDESYTPTTDTGSYCSSDSESILSSIDPETVNRHRHCEDEDDNDEDGDTDDGSSQMSSSDCASSSSYTPSSSRFDGAHNCEDDQSFECTASSNEDQNHEYQSEHHHMAVEEDLQFPDNLCNQDEIEKDHSNSAIEPAVCNEDKLCDELSTLSVRADENSEVFEDARLSPKELHRSCNRRSSKRRRVNSKGMTISSCSNGNKENALQEVHVIKATESMEVDSNLRSSVNRYLVPPKKHNQKVGRRMNLLGRRSSSVSSLSQSRSVKQQSKEVHSKRSRRQHHKSSRCSSYKRRAHSTKRYRASGSQLIEKKLPTSSDSSGQIRQTSNERSNAGNKYEIYHDPISRRQLSNPLKNSKDRGQHMMDQAEELWNEADSSLVGFEDLEYNIMQDGYFLMRHYNSDETLLRSESYYSFFSQEMPADRIHHERRFSGLDFRILKTNLNEIRAACSPCEEEVQESHLNFETFEKERIVCSPVGEIGTSEMDEGPLRGALNQPVERPFKVSVVSLLDHKQSANAFGCSDSSINLNNNSEEQSLEFGQNHDWIEVQLKVTRDLIRSLKRLLKHVVSYGYNNEIEQFTKNFTAHRQNSDELFSFGAIEDKLLSHIDYLSAKSLAKQIDRLDRELTSISSLDDSSSEAFIICRDSVSIKRISQCLRMKINQTRQNYVNLRGIRDHFIENHCDPEESDENGMKVICRSLDSLMDNYEGASSERSDNKQSSEVISFTMYIKKQEDPFSSEVKQECIRNELLDGNGAQSGSIETNVARENPAGKRKSSISSRCHFGTLCPVEFVYKIEKLLAYKRATGSRDGFKLNEMSLEQLSFEKLELQKNLIRYERWFGRPASSRDETNWNYVGHLYERYRLVKMMKSRLQKQQDNCDRIC